MKTAGSILVIGAGLAGTAAAITLARGGRAVTLVERDAVAKHKVCGEFLSGEALDLLRLLGVRPRELGAVPVGAVRLCSGKRVVGADLPFPALSLSRFRLDAAMLAAARVAGVTVRSGVAVEAVKPRGEGWHAALGDGSAVSVSHIILATGKHDLRGLPRPAGVQGNMVALKMYWQLAPAQAEALAGHVELFLHPGGYTGLQRVEGGAANFSALVNRRALARLGGWTGFLAALRRSSTHARERLDGAQPMLPKPLAVSPIPYGFVRREALGDGLWAVGDQAAVIPSFTGDGMSIALYSGLRAAEGVLGGESARVFQRALHRELRPQVRRATALSLALVHRPSKELVMLAARCWPGLLRGAARATRLPAAGLQRVQSTG